MVDCYVCGFFGFLGSRLLQAMSVSLKSTAVQKKLCFCECNYWDSIEYKTHFPKMTISHTASCHTGLFCIIQYCIKLYCTVCIVSYYIVLYCIVSYCKILYCIVLYCIIYCTVWFSLVYSFSPFIKHNINSKYNKNINYI